MRITMKSVHRLDRKWRTTLHPALLDPPSYVGSHYPVVRKCRSRISNPPLGTKEEYAEVEHTDYRVPTFNVHAKPRASLWQAS